jgi:uncharacterized protein (TIGR02231 family)
MASPPPRVSAEASALEESPAREVKSRVSEVTVYSDRARITRQATVKAQGEATVFAFTGLPGWVDDGSVQVSASAGRIVDVRVDRSFLATATDEAWTRLENEHRALKARLAALQDELAVLDAQKAQIEAIRAFSLAKISQDTTLGNVSVQSYGEVLRFISESLRATAEARRLAQARLDELKPEIDASQRRLEDAKALMQLEETRVLVTLQGTDSAPITLGLTYMLPGVTWEPLHELRAEGSGRGVELVSYASVTQTSGEDWGGAALSFSTQSSTQAVRIPELEALTLGDTVSATRRMTHQVSSFSRAQNAFKGQSELWNRLHQQESAKQVRSTVEQSYRNNVEYLEVVQGRTVKLFESLEHRGTSVHFQAEAARSVRGDGHPVRLPIGRAVLEASEKIVAAPESSLNAAHTLEMTNTTVQPILPGKVSLYRGRAFVGVTELDFVAKGEQFSVFLGIADQLKLTRELDRKQSSLVRRTRNQMRLSFVVTVENLGSTEIRFTLADRIPVSENKEIRVSQVSILPAVKPDSQGLLHWDLSLKPGEKREFTIGYQVEYPPELSIETSRRRAYEEKNRAPSPSSPMPSRKMDMEDQILDLESLF